MLRQVSHALAVLLLFAGPGALAQTAAPAPTAAPPIKPSFDCATAKVKWRLLVCGDAGLAALDVREEQMLRRARAKATQPDAVNADQDIWNDQRAGCTTTGCLFNAYRRRIGELREWTN